MYRWHMVPILFADSIPKFTSYAFATALAKSWTSAEFSYARVLILAFLDVACLFLIAMCFESPRFTMTTFFAFVTDNTYTKFQIRQMEMKILRVLNFSLGRPLPLHFLRRASKIGEVDVELHTLAKYLMELTMLDYDMVHFPPSQIAVGAFCLALKIPDNGE